MNPSAISGEEGSARAVVRDQTDVQESRLWDRARLNLMLLYGGWRSGGSHLPISGGGRPLPFSAADAEI